MCGILLAALALGSAPALASSGLAPVENITAPLVVDRLVLVAIPRPPAALDVDELIDGYNGSSQTVHAVSLALPAGAVGVTPGAGISAADFRYSAETAHLAVNLAPGQALHVSLSYVLSWNGGRLGVPVTAPTLLLTVLLPRPHWILRAPGFRSLPPLVLPGGQQMAAYATLTPSAGAMLTLHVLPDLWTPARRWVALGVALAAVAALAVLASRALGAWRRRRRERRARLVRSLASLDAALAAGALSAEEHRERRRGLVDAYLVPALSHPAAEQSRGG